MCNPCRVTLDHRRLRGGDPRHRASPGNEDRLARGRDRHPGGVLVEDAERLVGELAQVVRRPVVPQARRVVEHGLKLHVGHRLDKVDVWSQRTEALRIRLAVLHGGPRPHECQPAAQLALQIGGHERLGGTSEVEDEHGEFVRRVRHQVACEFKDLEPAAAGPQHESGEHRRAERVQRELERRSPRRSCRRRHAAPRTAPGARRRWP